MNHRGLALLTILACHVRFLTVSQAAEAVVSAAHLSNRSANQLVQSLAESGWVQVSQIFSRPISPLRQPLCKWRHAEPIPDFPQLSKYLHHRAQRPACLTRVVSATEKTLSLFGTLRSTPVRIKLTQATHDLQVAEVFLQYLRNGFEKGHRWIGEDALPETWPVRQRPDAILVDQAGDFIRAIEYGGDYSVERLTELHHALSSIPLSYEVW